MARIRFFSLIIFFLFFGLASSYASNIYRDTQNKFRFEIPQGWVVENQNQNPLTLLLKKSEKDKLGLDPIIILTKVDFDSPMPEDKAEVEEIVKNIDIPKDNPKIKSFKITNFDLYRSEKNYWFYYLTSYLYKPNDQKKWQKMSSLNYIIKTGSDHYSLVLVGPRKDIKKDQETIENLAKSLQIIFIP
jgi:hypothetical protein